MPAVTQSRHYYTNATKAVNHGAPCIENAIAGIAIKKKASPWNAGLTLSGGKAVPAQVAIGEYFGIEHKGEVYIDASLLPGAVKGSPVYITVATNAVTLTGPFAAGVTERYGRVVDLAGERGCPANKLRVSLDLKIGLA